MIRLSSCIPFVAVLLAAAAVLAMPQRSEAQSRLYGVLERQLETKNFQQPMTLKESLDVLRDMLTQQKLELPILIDETVFKNETPDAPDIFDTRIQFPPVPNKMTVAAALRFMLNQVATKNATYVVMPDYILVTTYMATSPECKLREKVRGVFEKRPLHAALHDLADMVGTTIVIDNRAGDKAKTLVSAAFLNEIDLAGAIRVLTEMAELKPVVLDGVIFVTTPAHEDTLRKEYVKKLMDLKKLRSMKEKAAPPAGLGGFGLPGFPGAATTNPFAPDPEPMVDPFWPYPSSMSRRVIPVQ